MALLATVFLALPAIARATTDTVLSNETTFTAWTIADGKAPVRKAPSTSARTITHLKLWTSDGYPEVYIALAERTVRHRKWLQVRLPMRPNGLVGWVKSTDVEPPQVIHTQIVIDRAAHQLTLYRNGNQVMTVPVGVGKASTPTPTGHFWITEKFHVHNSPVYGPYAMGTSAYSHLTDWPGGGVVGIHGTNEPALVPGNPSHGCVRLHNSDILKLVRQTPIGTPVLIV